MSVYSNKMIRAAIDEGHIVCHPFVPKHVGHASLDITLGYYYYRVEKANERTLYNPFDPEDVERYFDGPYKAMRHDEWCRLNGFMPVKNISLSHPVISLKPGERILAHSHEFFGIIAPGTFEVKPRSTWSRNGIIVGLGDNLGGPGYVNRFTLSISNLNERETVLLPVGERIAQAVFIDTGEVEGSYGQGDGYGLNGKYQHGIDLDTIIKIWSPDMLLPKAYRDQRTMPQKIEGLQYE